MLIGNTPLNGCNLDKMITMLKSLPSGFAKRNVFNDGIVYASTDGFQNYQAAMLKYAEFRVYGAHSIFDQIINCFNTSIDLCVRDNDILGEANGLYNLAIFNMKQRQYNEAKANLLSAIENFKKKDALHLVYSALGDLYECCIQLMRKSLDVKEKQSLQLEMDFIKHEINAIYFGGYYKILNKDAHRIEQGFIGFSDNEPIGTDNVHECVCLVVQDPVTKKTALAHIDEATDIYSLQALFDRMPKPKVDQLRLQIKLIGAKFGDKFPENGRDKRLAKVSHNNLIKLLHFLREMHVKIISADIFNDTKPNNIVVYPQTFEILEEVPGMKNPNREIESIFSCVAYKCKHLQISFDLTSSLKRAPLLFQPDPIDMQEIYNKQEIELYDYWKARVLSNACAVELVQQSFALLESCKSSYKSIIEAFDRKMRDLGMTEDEEIEEYNNNTRNAVRAVIQKKGFHIGEDANRANKPIIDLIADKLFKPTDDGGYEVDEKDIVNFTFNPQPYNYLYPSNGLFR